MLEVRALDAWYGESHILHRITIRIPQAGRGRPRGHTRAQRRRQDHVAKERNERRPARDGLLFVQSVGGLRRLVAQGHTIQETIAIAGDVAKKLLEALADTDSLALPLPAKCSTIR